MSKENWILAVLEDLRRYAAKNGLTDLERQLQQASQTARQELSGGASDIAHPPSWDGEDAGGGPAGATTGGGNG